MLRFGSLILLTLSIVSTNLSSAQDKDKGHFYFCGQLNSQMAEGGKPATVNKGLAFSITLTDGGKTISAGKVDLSIPGFGADGRVYIFQENDGGFGSNLCEMYQPF